MGFDLYLTTKLDGNVDYELFRLVGDNDFMDCLWNSGDIDRIVISEYDGEYAYRPLDFKQFLIKLKENTNIQDAHFELYNYLNEHENVYVGFSN